VRVEAQAALVGPPGVVVLHAVRGKGRHLAAVAQQAQRDGHLTLRAQQQRALCGRQTQVVQSLQAGQRAGNRGEVDSGSTDTGQTVREGCDKNSRRSQHRRPL
jgi:hypothetical protein